MDYFYAQKQERHSWTAYDRNEGSLTSSSRDDDPWVYQDPHQTGVHSKLRDCVYKTCKEYCDEITAFAANYKLSAIRFNRYPEGTRLKLHYDHIHSVFDGNRKGIPVISVIGQLNDDYEGGEVVINKEVIPLKQGDVLLFPSVFLYPHEILTVTKGERVSFVGWVY